MNQCRMSQKVVDKLLEAAQTGDLARVKLLVNAGVDVNSADDPMKMTAFHHATDRGHVEICKYLQAQGADIHGKTLGGHTPFTIACYQGALPIVRWLLESGSDIAQKDDAGFTGLHGASRNGKLDTVKYLVESGADVNGRSNQGYTPLFYAGSGGHLAICEYLLYRGAEVQVKTRGGNTILNFVCHSGHLPVVKWLVESGCDVNGIDHLGETSLHRVCQTGNYDIVKYLLTQGARMDIKSRLGKTAIHIAAENSFYSVCKLMVTHGGNLFIEDNDGETPINIATSKGYLNMWLLATAVQLKAIDCAIFIDILSKSIKNENVQVAKHLVNNVGINALDKQGKTLLHHTVESNRADLCEFLISERADVTIKDTNEVTPLQLATSKGHHDLWLVVNYQRLKSVDIQTLNSALCKASEAGNYKVVEHLVKGGVPLNIRDTYGFTALHLAVINDHFDVAKYLLSCGVNIHIQDSEGHTPLMLATSNDHLRFWLLTNKEHIKTVDVLLLYTVMCKAIETGNITVLKHLVEIGVDVNMFDDNGFTFLHHAARSGNIDICQYLHSRAIALNPKDKDGSTPLIHACTRGHLSVVQWLVQNGCDVLKTNVYGGTALSHAIDSKHENVVGFIVQHLVDSKMVETLLKANTFSQETNQLIKQLGEEILVLQTQLKQQIEENTCLRTELNTLKDHVQNMGTDGQVDQQQTYQQVTVQPADGTAFSSERQAEVIQVTKVIKEMKHYSSVQNIETIQVTPENDITTIQATTSSSQPSTQQAIRGIVIPPDADPDFTPPESLSSNPVIKTEIIESGSGGGDGAVVIKPAVLSDTTGAYSDLSKVQCLNVNGSGGGILIQPATTFATVVVSDNGSAELSGVHEGASVNGVPGYVLHNTVSSSVMTKQANYSDITRSLTVAKGESQNTTATNQLSKLGSEDMLKLRVENKALHNKVIDLENKLRTSASKQKAMQSIEDSTVITTTTSDDQTSTANPSSSHELLKYIGESGINKQVLNANSATHLTTLLLKERYSDDQLQNHSAKGAGKSRRPSLDESFIRAIIDYVQCVYPGACRTKLITAINQACSDARKRKKMKIKYYHNDDELEQQPYKRRPITKLLK